jgi:hypothetical protein
MTDDPNERLARLEERIWKLEGELEGSIRGCKTDIRVLAVGLVVVFLLGSRMVEAMFGWTSP